MSMFGLSNAAAFAQIAANDYQNAQMMYQQTHQGGKTIGGIVGGIAGAVLGGPIGSVIGAGVGSAIGKGVQALFSNPGSGSAAGSVLGGVAGTALAGPIGGALGAGLGSAIGGRIGANTQMNAMREFSMLYNNDCCCHNAYMNSGFGIH